MDFKNQVIKVVCKKDKLPFNISLFTGARGFYEKLIGVKAFPLHGSRPSIYDHVFIEPEKIDSLFKEVEISFGPDKVNRIDRELIEYVD